MKDFIKIFLGISALVAAFLFGKGHGEKSFEQSAEYRDFIKTKEELSFNKNELENIKAKLQNITDAAETKKTDELLAQILHVFLTDLGLRIQNKELILKKAEIISRENQKSESKKEISSNETASKRIEDLKLHREKPAKINYSKMKTSEWMVTNAMSEQDALRALKKVEIKNLKSFLGDADFIDLKECEALVGTYKGNLKDINKKNFGSMEVEMKLAQTNSRDEFYGKVAWYHNGNALAEAFNKNCGRKIKNLSGRIFGLSADKYVQVYKLNSVDKLAGNFYENSPNGTTTIIGSFLLNRVDKF